MEKDNSIKLQIEEILQSSKEEIKTKIINSLQDELEQKIRWNMDSQITGIVNEFFKNELKDEIQNVLLTSREPILEAIKNGIVECSGEIAKSMLAKASKNLDSYGTDKVVKALFNIY